MTDEELMMAYLEGDMTAFQALFHRHKGRVLGYLISRLNNRDEAEDVFQETFAKLHAKRFLYKSGVPFLPWLFTITKNAMVDYIRKRDTRAKYIKPGEEAVERSAAEERESPPIGETIAGLTSLSPQQRRVLEMRFNEGLSFDDIAAQLNTTGVNARQIASRAVRKLRSLMTGKEL